ncbi:MAG: solute carrier family 26 protein [Alphaproteobacteria bacterium]|nr:solute carrier family 26 protein [Alphaproteobacteria bacterium]
MGRLATALPALRWMRGYDRKNLPGDVTAGITTAVMLIPQAMAYAMLAGLPPIVGLYASTVPLAIYALLGSSRQLAVGPVAMVSLMVASGSAALSEAGHGDPVTLALVLAGLVGVLQLGMGIARLGFLVNLLSHPVISGFTSAAALIIGLSQLKHLLGVPLARSHHVHEIALEAVSRAGEIHPVTLLIGVAGMAALMALKRWKPAFPGALVVVGAASLAVWGLGLADAGVAIVGEVPSGLPAPALPPLDAETWTALAPTALAIALVGFMESISVAKAFATRNRYRVDANQELIALGAANLGAAAFGGYPVTGGFSRTAVNAQAGSRTPLASLITAGVVALTLLFLTPLFYFLPKAVLASIVMVAVFGLVDVRTFLRLLKVKPADALMLAITFFATLSLGIELGVGLGVAASLLAFLRRTASPHVAMLGRVPGSDEYRNLARHPEAIAPDGIAVMRVDEALWFGNVAALRAHVDEALNAEPAPRAFVLDMSAVNDVDASGVEALEELVDELERQDIALILVRVKGPVLDVLRRAGLVDHLGPARIAETVREAVERVQEAVPLAG